MAVRVSSIATVALGALALTACHARGPAAPLLTAVSPTQLSLAGGQVGTLTVRGHGFDSLNTVHFGALRIPAVPRTNDTLMQFAVPTDDTFLPNRGPAPVRALSAGTYDVRVETARGVSNAMTITLVSGGVR